MTIYNPPARRRQVRRKINRIVQHWMPGLYERLRFRFGHPATMAEIGRVVANEFGSKVSSGSFAGMICSDATTGSIVPKLLGCYEEELHGVLEFIRRQDYRQIIDVGCGEGYYAVGLARMLPRARVMAFDISERARAACLRQAQENQVADRVQVGGECDPRQLAKILEPGALVVSDCEGHEFELLRPEIAPQLLQCDILVELHDLFVPGITAEMESRFGATHEITLVDAKERDPSTYDVLRPLSTRQQMLAVNEFRGGAMQWAWMRSHNRPVAAAE